MVVTKRSDMIIQKLIGEIMAGEKGQDGRLPSANQISEEYGISIVTVREALKILEAMGIVTIEHGKGIFVGSPEKIIEDLLEVRLLIEADTARQAAEHITPEKLETLKVIYERMIDPLIQENDVEYSSLDYELHHQIALIGGNRILLKMLENVRIVMSQQILESNRDSRTERESHRKHEALVLAIGDGDAESAQNIMREHLIGVYRAYERSRELGKGENNV